MSGDHGTDRTTRCWPAWTELPLFVPLIVAVVRHVPNVGSVAVINIFLGWTLIGWVVALAMAVRSVPPTAPKLRLPPPP